MTTQSLDWDEYGERVVGADTCLHCGERIDQWEIRIDPSIAPGRQVLLWKHRSDGAVMCGGS